MPSSGSKSCPVAALPKLLVSFNVSRFEFLYSETHAVQNNGSEGPRELAGFLVNSDGSLTPISPAPLLLPTNDFGIHTLTMSPNGNFLYVSSMYTVINLGVSVVTTMEIQAYAIDQNTGALTKTEDYTWDTRQTGYPTSALAIDPTDPDTGALSPISGVQNWPLVSTQPDILAIVRPQ